MKKGLIISLAAAVLGLSAISCTKNDPTLRYSNVTMGNVVNGKFTSDQGNIFNVTEQTCYGKLDTMKRAFVICDVLKNSGTAENEYDVRVNYIANVLTKDALSISDIPDMGVYKNDPIIVKDFWFSGGYLNMYITSPVEKNSDKKHLLNLFYEKKDGAYRFELRHDAMGEVLTDSSYNGNVTFSYAYVSFPISEIITEDTARYTLTYNSYIINGNMVSAQTRQVEHNKTYEKSKYQQVPDTAATPTETFEVE